MEDARPRRPWFLQSRFAAGMVALLVVLAAAVVVAMAALWPTGDPPAGGGSASMDTQRARVTAVRDGACKAGAGAEGCRRVLAVVETGVDTGVEIGMDIGPGFGIDVGDRIRVVDNNLADGATIGGQAADAYSFADFERRGSLMWLAAGFALLVVLAARWRGLLALTGLVLSLAVIVAFIVPAILDGRDAVGVALVGSLAILLVTLGLAHGLGPKTVAAALGTAAALLLTLMLGRFATGAAEITGFGSEEAAFLQASGSDVSIRGLLLAGIVIAALGVLDDLTVTQASAVLALRRANPGYGARVLFTEALKVGRDHIVAVVNTLVLAYAGASLPVLLVFALADTSFSEALNSEAVAAEVVATLVGSMGLIAAVPLATGIAAALAARMPPEAVPAAGGHHGHMH
ncbi:MAG: YibE/F family protein [Thermoleophilia bacterium]